MGRTSTGLSCCACARHDRAGRLLYPGDGGALPTGDYSPAGTRRFPAASPYDPAATSHRRGALSRDINGGSRYSPITPGRLTAARNRGALSPPVFSSPVTLGWNKGPWASTSMLRTPRLPATHVEVETGHRALARVYTFDISRTSNGVSHLHSCALMPQVVPSRFHDDQLDLLLGQPGRQLQQRPRGGTKRSYLIALPWRPSGDRPPYTCLDIALGHVQSGHTLDEYFHDRSLPSRCRGYDGWPGKGRSLMNLTRVLCGNNPGLQP
jgi:hypothetical protein